MTYAGFSDLKTLNIFYLILAIILAILNVISIFSILKGQQEAEESTS